MANTDIYEKATPENAVIAGLADRAAARELVTIADGRQVALVVPDGHEVQTFDLDEFGEHPVRKTGAVRLHDAQSLVEYFGVHSDANSTLWAHEGNATVTAVLDDHGADYAGWGGHRAHLQLQTTPEWKHWADSNGRSMSQRQFAEHIEDGFHEIVVPAAAEMLELAQSFHATNSATFRSATRLQSGETQLTYVEDIQAQAGHAGQIEIPRKFTLELATFEGTPEHVLEAYLRYQIRDGKLTLSYKLIRPEKVRKEAFDDVTSSITEGTGHLVLAGAPR